MFDRNNPDPRVAEYANVLIITHGLDGIRDQDGWETLEHTVRSRWDPDTADAIIWLLEYEGE